MSLLGEHAFPIKAKLKQSLVLTYAVPAAELEPLIPKRLKLDLYKEDTAFVAAAMVDTENMRPSGFPSFLGRRFILIGYRIFVRYTGKDGRTKRGLYILGSETNSKFMAVSGNLMTSYSYQHVDIDWQVTNNKGQTITSSSELAVDVCEATENAPLPTKSPFPDWRQARRFAGPMPFTFSHNSERDEVLIVEGKRQGWKPLPIEVKKHSVPFFDQYQFSSFQLANAFLVSNLDYEWKKGITESWS